MEHESFVPDLLIRSTGDIDLDEIGEAFRVFQGSARVDDRQFFFKSQQSPSFVQIVASLPWWAQLGVGGLGIVATGYLNQAGVSLWNNQHTLVDKLSESLWYLVDSIIKLSVLLDPESKVMLAFPVSDEYFPAVLEIEAVNAEETVRKVAALSFHASNLQRFAEDASFDPIASPLVRVWTDGSLEISWMDRTSMSQRQHMLAVE